MDLIKTGESPVPRPALGGPSTYVSLAATKMNAKASVISKVGRDFPREYREWLINEGVDLSMLIEDKTASTTSYLLIYSGRGERQLILRSRAPPIKPEEIPESLSSEAIHISPIAGEVSYAVIEKLRGHADLLSLDPQGFLRRFDRDGRTRLRRLEDPRILSKIDILKASRREIEAATGEAEISRAVDLLHRWGLSLVIVTMGREGALLSLSGKIYRIPSARSRAVVDTTGAGDVFIGTFLAEYVKGEDPIWCSCVGSASASYVIQEVGPRGFGTQFEVYERASQIYEGVSPA